MINNSSEINNFHNLLKKQKLDNPIPSDVQEKSIVIQKRVLINTLKSTNNLSLFYKLVIAILFFLLGKGINLSIVKCKIIAFTILSLTTISVTGGGYYTTVKIVNMLSGKQTKKILPKQEIIQKKVTLKKQNAEQIIQKKPDLIVKKNNVKSKKSNFIKTKYNLKIELFKNRNSNNKNSYQITNYLKNKIALLIGNKVAILEKNKISQKNDRLLIGTWWKTNNKYYITLKLVNAKSSVVLFAIYKEFSEKSKNKVCTEIAQKIVKKLR